MAEGIDIPIRMPTETSDVKAAKGVVGALNDALKALGPAAKKGSDEARRQMIAFKSAAKAAENASKEASKQETLRTKAAETANTAKLKSSLQSDLLAQKHAQQIDLNNQKAFLANQAATQKHLHDVHKKRIDQEVKETAQAEKLKVKAQTKAEREAKREAIKAEKTKAKEAAQAQKAKIKADKKAADEAKKNALGIQQASLGNRAIATAANMALGAMVAVTAAVGALTAKFATALVAVAAFRESTLGAFSKLLKSTTAADKVFKETIKTADDIGIAYRDALSGVNSLVAKGFGADEAQMLVKAMADLKSVSPEANIKNLLLAISQIKGKGRVAMEELRGQIAEAGLDISVVLNEIGKPIGKSAQEVEKLISQGKISADQGVKGILSAIQKITGKPIGEAAKDASKSLAGLISRVEQLPEGILMMTDASKGLGTFKGVLENILGAFGPSTKGGQALAGAFGKLGDALGSFLSGLTGKEGAKALESFAMGGAKAIDQIATALGKLGAIMGPRMGKAFEMMGAVMGNETLISTFVASIDMSTKSLSLLIGIADGVRDALSAMGSWFSGIGTMISNAAAAVFGKAQSIGSNLVQGIIAGLNAASPLLAAAVQAVAAMTTNTSKQAHTIQSPSKEWKKEIGYQLPAGEAEGIYAGAPLITRAAQDVAGDTTAAGTGAARGSGLGRGVAGGRNVTIEAGAVVIHVGSQAQARSVATELNNLFVEWANA